jgi:uncharacterized phage protein gp47/JayE
MPDGVTLVTNPEPFTGGSEPEGIDSYRRRLLQSVRSPGTGSETDLKTWAEEIDGVDKATIIANDNMGTPTPGHATVRISGPNGSIPTSDLVDLVQETLDAKDMANITIHVTTFDPLAATVSVVTTREESFTLENVVDSVIYAITQYVQGLDVGETLRVNGIVCAIFGLPGIEDVEVTDPTEDIDSGPMEKWTISEDDIDVG